MSGQAEKHYPTVIAVLSTLAASVLFLTQSLAGWKLSFVGGCEALFTPALNVSAIATGFLATAESILLSLSTSRTVKELKRKKDLSGRSHYTRMVDFFSIALAASFSWALLSGVLATLHFKKGGWVRYSLLLIWIFASVFAICAYYRASSLLTEVLRSEDQQNSASKTSISPRPPAEFLPADSN